MTDGKVFGNISDFKYGHTCTWQYTHTYTPTQPDGFPLDKLIHQSQSSKHGGLQLTSTPNFFSITKQREVKREKKTQRETVTKRGSEKREGVGEE